jgi:phosphatidylglycerophosphatase A
MRDRLLSFFGAGRLRPAPGTWGSLAALPVAWVLHLLGGPYLLAIAIGLGYGIGVPLIEKALADSDEEDPGWIVLDEVVGQWIALLPVSFGAMISGANVLALWPGILAAFVWFRAFDIWKPGPVGWADRRGDALGVMLDDVIAGVLAALLVVAMAAFSHLWLVP